MVYEIDEMWEDEFNSIQKKFNTALENKARNMQEKLLGHLSDDFLYALSKEFVDEYKKKKNIHRGSLDYSAFVINPYNKDTTNEQLKDCINHIIDNENSDKIMDIRYGINLALEGRLKWREN